jgi:hypothetical protein
MKGDVRRYWRRGGDWDIAAHQAEVEEHDVDPFLLWVLQNVAAGRERCGSCRRVFGHTREVALVTELVASTPPQATPDVHLQAYCLPCTQAHADAITSPPASDVMIH